MPTPMQCALVEQASAPATTSPLDDNEDLKELYGRLIGQWSTEMRHVVAIVGAAFFEAARKGFADVL